MLIQKSSHHRMETERLTDGADFQLSDSRCSTVMSSDRDSVSEVNGPLLEKSRFSRVCVFCGSSPGRKKSFQEAAVQLGIELVKRKINLVYGGGSAGLMGFVSQAVHNAGGNVLGIMPQSLLQTEITGKTIGELKIVACMHQRKAQMACQADAFIALPGGYGTLEELLEVISWAQLGIHSKPVGLLNVEGYYNSLLALIDSAIEEGFIMPSQRNLIISATSAKELIQKLEEYAPLENGVETKLWEKRLKFDDESSSPPSVRGE